MTISHVWFVKSLEYSDTAKLSKVVNRVNWTITSDDGAGHVWSRGVSSPVGIPNPNTFTDFETLTEEYVLGWRTPSFIAAQEALAAADIQVLIDAETAAVGVGVPW
jgi:hypothetical protein